MPETKETKEMPLLGKTPVKKSPKPTVTGDDRITILKHHIYKKGEEALGVELTIKNVSGKTIANALFEAVFYDKKGNIVDIVEYKTSKLRVDVSLVIRIISSKPERNRIESYAVKLIKTTIPPTPTATGSDELAILNHKLYEPDEGLDPPLDVEGAKLVIKNVSDRMITSAIFEVIFYDIEGNIVYRFEHRETVIKPNNSRSILIFPPEPTRNVLKSYNIRVIRVMTPGVEKVQVRGHDIITNEDGEEEARGTVKNLSDVKLDAILVATFYDDNKETVGAKAVILRDIEPDSIKRFHFRFRPQEGDIVKTYNLKVVCDIDECQ